MNTHPFTHTRTARGFSLMEILVVVAIIAILAAVVVPRFMDEPDKARVAKAKQDIQAIVTALNMYRLDNYTYPSTEQGLEALVREPAGRPEAPNWQEGGYLQEVPTDPWGRDYQYQYPGQHGDFDVWSLGRDGMSGGEGVDADIGNWTAEGTSG